MRVGAAVLVAVSLLGCRGQGANYAGAALAVGAAVALAAANRAATDDCWGGCSHGFVCDRRAGVCVPLPEVNGQSFSLELTPEDLGCIREDDGRWLCPDDPATEAPREPTESYYLEPAPCRIP